MFYGWVIVAITFLAQFVAFGTLQYSFGVLFKPLAADLGGSRFAISMALPMLSAVASLASPLVGRWIDAGWVRAVMVSGALCGAVGFVALSYVQTLWQFYVVFALPLALVFALLAGIVNPSLVANWFVRRRGMALGISQIGVSISGAVMVYVSTALVEAWGWRGAVRVFAGVFAFGVAPLVWALVVSRPEEKGQHPDGRSVPVEPSSDTRDPEGPGAWTLGRALRERSIVIIACVVGLNYASMGAVIGHIIPHLTDLGHSAKLAAAAFSLMAAFGAIGKPSWGLLGDRIAPRTATWLCMAAQALGLALLLVASSGPAVVGASILFGAGYGGVMPLYGLLVGATYGRQYFGRVMGIIAPVMLPLHMFGMPFAGWTFDRTGSYDVAFITFIAFYAVAALLLLLLRLPETKPALVIS